MKSKLAKNEVKNMTEVCEHIEKKEAKGVKTKTVKAINRLFDHIRNGAFSEVLDLKEGQEFLPKRYGPFTT